MSTADSSPDLQAPDIRSLESAYRGRSARVTVIGLGYVGLPLALALTGAGFAVTGFDIDPAKAAAPNGGRSYIRQIADGRVAHCPLVVDTRNAMRSVEGIKDFADRIVKA